MTDNDTPSFDDSQFFDDEGNLIGTSWGLRAQLEEERETKAQEEKEKARKRKELNRRIAIDNSQAEFMDKHEKTLHKRKIKEKWLSMPPWIKKMPRTPLSDPPTVGKKEILLTKMTGKTHLTDAERKQRTRDLQKLKLSINDYEKIHQKFDGVRMLPTAVMSLGDGVGGTMLVRAMSAALAESRGDYGKVVSLDLAPAGNKFNEWFGIKNNQYAYMKSVYKWINSQDNSLGVDFIPSANGIEFHLSNRPEKNHRVEPTEQLVMTLYQSVSAESGVLLFDCSYDEFDSALLSVLLSTTPVFVLPLHKDAISKLNNVFNTLESRGVPPEKIQEIKDNCILVASSIVQEMSDAKGREIVKNFLSKAASDCGISGGDNDERLIHIQYDKQLEHHPLNWKKTGFLAQHAVRSICGFIVDDVAEEMSE